MNDNTTVPVPLEPLPKDGDDRRLWIGNLDPRVTEFKLLKLLQKFGSIKKFDFLFHHSGPMEGQPRGYAFVTYSTSEVAHNVKTTLNGKPVGGKNICVKWAHHLAKDELDKSKCVPEIPALAGAKSEKNANRMNTIQAIEAKLKVMEKASDEFKITDKPSVATNTPAYNKNHLKSASSSKQYERHKYKAKPYSRSKWK